MPLHLLFLSHEFPPDGGGAGVNLALLCTALQARGVQATVWVGASSFESEGARAQESGSFASLHRLPVTSQRRKRFETALRLHARFIWGAWRKARKENGNPDWVIGNMAIPGGIAAVLVGRRFKARIAIWHHGSDVHGGRSGGAKLWQTRLLRWLWKYSRVNYFVAPSLLALASGYGTIPKPRLLPSMLDPDFAERAKALSVETKGNARVTQGYFLVLGRFEAVKDPLLALEAYAIYTQKIFGLGPGLKLRFVGEGSLHAQLQGAIDRKGLNNQVTLEAAVARATVFNLLQGAYALLMPSRAEGMSLTVLEAGALGVPTIGAASLGLSDSIRSEETGLLFTPGDAEAFAEQLLRLAKQNDWRNALGEKARDWAIQHTPEVAATSLLAGLDET